MDSCIKSFDGRTFYATDFCCCPHCGATDIKKNGKTKGGRQRWICKGCGRTFTGRSGTILFSSKLKPVQIKKMFSLLIDGTTLRQAGHMANVSLQTVLLWRRKIEKVRRIKDFPMLSGNVHVDETYVNVARHGELSVKRGVSKSKLRIAVAVDDTGHCMAKVSGYGMPKNRESERDFGAMIERGSHVTHDDSNYGHAFEGRAVTTVNSKSRDSHFLMNPINRFCCRIQRIFAVHLRIHRSNVQKYLDTLCADYVSGKDNFQEFLSENRGKIFSSGIMLRRSDVYGCSATL
jgi:transposase-like protein